MDDNQVVKNAVFGIMDGQNRRGRLTRESMDNTKLHSALAINSVLYPVSHMSLFLAPLYVCLKSKNSCRNTRPLFRIISAQFVVLLPSSFFLHLRSFRRVRPAHTHDIAKTVGSAVHGGCSHWFLHGTSANI